MRLVKGLFSIFLFCITTIAFAQKALPVAGTAIIFEAIEKEYSTINKDTGKYRKVIKHLNRDFAGEGYIVGYYDANQLKAIRTYLFGEFGELQSAYYLKDGILFYTKHTEYCYEESWGREGTLQPIHQYEYFFYNNLLLSQNNLALKKSSFCNSLNDEFTGSVDSGNIVVELFKELLSQP